MMRCQATSKTKTQQSTGMIVSFETSHAPTVTPDNAQNESDDVSLSIQEYAKQIMVNRDIEVGK
eukprot:14590043-Ditylum_brightwellii.AAC.1